MINTLGLCGDPRHYKQVFGTVSPPGIRSLKSLNHFALELNALYVLQKTTADQNSKSCIRTTIIRRQQYSTFIVLSATLNIKNLQF